MKTLVLTNAHLKGACPSQRVLFNATFPKGAPCTLAALRKARAAGLDVFWLTSLFDDPAWMGFQKARRLSWAEYAKLVHAATVEFGKLQHLPLLFYRLPAWPELKPDDISAVDRYRTKTNAGLIQHGMRCDAALLAGLRATLGRKAP